MLGGVTGNLEFALGGVGYGNWGLKGKTFLSLYFISFFLKYCDLNLIRFLFNKFDRSSQQLH